MFKFLRKTALWILLTPLAIWTLGAASNQLVLNVNNDTFPVRISGAELAKAEAGEIEDIGNGNKIVGNVLVLADGTIMLDYTHCVMTSKTHLNLLADIIDMHTETESVGDILLGIGDWGWSLAPYMWGLALIGKIRED